MNEASARLNVHSQGYKESVKLQRSDINKSKGIKRQTNKASRQSKY